MKRLKRYLPAVFSIIVRLYLWLLYKTCKINYQLNDKALALLLNNKPCLIATWHGRLLLCVKFLAHHCKFSAVVSSHFDGELVAKTILDYGNKVIRGSSNKGAFGAMKGIINAVENKEIIAITPDGPKGPVHKAKGAITAIAVKYQLPIVAFCYSASRSIKFNSWDSFMVPLPFSKITISLLAPICYNTSQEAAELDLTRIMNLQLSGLDLKYKI